MHRNRKIRSENIKLLLFVSSTERRVMSKKVIKEQKCVCVYVYMSVTGQKAEVNYPSDHANPQAVYYGGIHVFSSPVRLFC